MGHIQDRWFTTKYDPDTGKEKRVKTAQHGKGLRYKVRYLDPAGREKSKSFPNKCKKEAEDFLLSVESDQREGRYVDPNAGRMLLRDYAANWIKGQAADPNSRDVTQRRLNTRILPFLGDKPLWMVERPATIRNWIDWLRSLDSISENYAAMLCRTLSSLLESAVAEKLIHSNPFRSKGFSRPRVKVVPAVAWDLDRVAAIRSALPARERIAVDLGVCLGLRFGEIAGLSTEDIDEAAGVVHVRRQVRQIRGSGVLVFSDPKMGKMRDVPLSPDVANRLRDYLREFPAQQVTLATGVPGGPRATYPLIISRPDGRPWKSSAWYQLVWKPAFTAAGLTRRPRVDGTHALRHTFASVLLARGVSIREVAEYLGHERMSFTLEIYTHLLPNSHQRAQAAVTDFLRSQEAGGSSQPGSDQSSDGPQAA